MVKIAKEEATEGALWKCDRVDVKPAHVSEPEIRYFIHHIFVTGHRRRDIPFKLF